MHAYLIMAHSHLNMLHELLIALDDTRNDLFVHIDIKAGPIDESSLIKDIRYSKVFFVNRKNVIWGHYSQIDCEMSLFKFAQSAGEYQYFHMVSGADFPIKSQDYIHSFFDSNTGKEFVHIESNDLKGDNNEKVDCYFWFQKYIGHENKNNSFLYIVQRLLIRTQKIIGIKRHRNEHVKFYKGANWVSITGNFVKCLLSREDWIKKTFKHSLCCDEIFLQTVLMNSEYKENLYNSEFQDDYLACMRLIDWNRGTPYVFRKSDLEQLLSSQALYARKFDEQVDNEIIEILMRINKSI